MVCCICNKESQKLFKNGVCSLSCNSKLNNKIRIENGTHNRVKSENTTIECIICSQSILKINFPSHSKICKKYYCLNCKSEFISKVNKFCSKSCSATFNNKSRILTKDKDELFEVNCTKCKIIVLRKRNASKTKVICKECKIKPKYPITCIGCNKVAMARKKTGMFCSKECRINSDHFKAQCLKAGRNSAKTRLDIRRSKNEMYFSELCKEEFQNVLENEPMFNGWDADVILPDLKIAILWNGVWHYKIVHKNHKNLSQTQNRDKIKMHEIEKAEYKVYVVKDMGSYDKSFVDAEFKLFKTFLSHTCFLNYN